MPCFFTPKPSLNTDSNLYDQERIFSKQDLEYNQNLMTTSFNYSHPTSRINYINKNLLRSATMGVSILEWVRVKKSLEICI